MASIMWNKGEQSLIDTWLIGDTTKVPTVTTGSWGVGMGCQAGGVGTDKTRVNGTNPASTIAELGTASSGAVLGGYARQPLLRVNNATTGWPLSSPPGAGQSYQSTAGQVTFTFTASPNQNGAILWFLALSTTVAANDCYFGSDLAATRNFTNGDTEKITITYRQQ